MQKHQKQKVKTFEELAQEQGLRVLLVDAVKRRTNGLEKTVGDSMTERYPNGMTPKDISYEIEENIENVGYTSQMPNINLSSESVLEAIMNNQHDQLQNALLIVAMESPDLYASALALDLYFRVGDLEKDREIDKTKELLEMEREEIRAELQAAIDETKDELKAATKEDRDELRDAIADYEADRKHAEKNREEEPKGKKHGLKKVLAIDLER